MWGTEGRCFSIAASQSTACTLPSVGVDSITMGSKRFSRTEAHHQGKQNSNFTEQAATVSSTAPIDGGKLLILTAPLTEIIDHAGYFIQMAMASLPIWLEGILNRKYPQWRDLEYNEDGSARYMPAGVRLLEASLLRRFAPGDIVACYPDDLHKFVGPKTRLVAVSTHNPMGVTFATGVYASIFGSSKQPINSHYAAKLFASLKKSPWRGRFKVIVGGSGAWQIAKTNMEEEFGIDCIVEGRSESAETTELIMKAIRMESLPKSITAKHPSDRDSILIPVKRTTFGVVELTTGCGRRCSFCLPDLSPQLDLPKDKILQGVRANIRDGNKQISLATEDFFIWGQVQTDTPFYFPNREALLDLFADVVKTPGVEQHILSHCTIAPAVVDPILIQKLSELLLDKSPIHLPMLSTHPQKKILSPLIGLETGSVSLAKKIMPSKAVPFPIEEWPSVFIQGLSVLNSNNWFPVITLMIGTPGETDEDIKATLDLLYETERRGLFAFFVPSVFAPLHDTRMAEKEGIRETHLLTSLQWQLMLKCWKMNLRIAQFKWYAPVLWKLGAIVLWLSRLRRLNGPNFTWPLILFSSVLPEKMMARMGKIYLGQQLKIKSRKELLAIIRPQHWKHLRADTGDLLDTFSADRSSF